MNKSSLSVCITICLFFISAICFSQNIKFSYDACGNRTVRITVTKETKSELADSIVLIKDNPIEQNLKNLNIVIYPNPTTDILHISIEGLPINTNIDAYLFSLSGQLIEPFHISDQGQTVDLHKYSPGLYFLKIRINDKVESWKIVKQ